MIKWYKCLKWQGHSYISGKYYQAVDGLITCESGVKDHVYQSWIMNRFIQRHPFSDYLKEIELL